MAGMEPSAFIDSMRVLFNIMDDRKQGFVKFIDIERRWSSGEANSGLPKGILECLRNLSNADGELTFERFCAGLKICLLKNDSTGQQQQQQPPPPKPPRMNPDAINAATAFEEFSGSSKPRREPRRHTLTNGIDYNRLKRLKQLEQEKTLLKETLATVNQTQIFLNQKLHSVHDQIRHVGRSTAPLDTSTVNYQQRLELKRAQTAELNRNLVRLVNNWSSIDKNNYLFELNLETTRNEYSA